MKKKENIIISVSACGGKMNCRKQAAEFSNPPVVININSSNGAGISTGGATIQGFKDAAKAYKEGQKNILDNILLKSNIKNPEKICLISYLDGWSFIHEILKTQAKQKYDFSNDNITIIILEGLNSRNLDCWKYYLKTGGNLWLAYTERTHKIISCKAAAQNLLKNCRKTNNEIPEYITSLDFDKSVSIYSKQEQPKTKIYHSDPFIKGVNKGNLCCLQYGGKQLQDQTYIQQYVQPRLWRWLKEKWE